MERDKVESLYWSSCPDCQGRGKKSKGINKKVRQRYQEELELFEKSNYTGTAPIVPKGYRYTCTNCNGSGLIATSSPPQPDHDKFPHIAIIGGGIGGVALGIACLHRRIPFTIYERDSNFDARSQGYGLTLQQASKAIEGLGVFNLKEGVVSTKHIVHTTDGKIIGEWGNRKWIQKDEKKAAKKTNMHIARQLFRLALLEQLGGPNVVKWGHQFLNYEQVENAGISLTFDVNGTKKFTKADLIVGADGIRSAVRKLAVGDHIGPLRYLDCIVILGICPLSALNSIESDLLDSATVFQTANGVERIYVMPYTATSVMWQLSFPMSEELAKNLSARGPDALKNEAILRTGWHKPIPSIVASTPVEKVSGYPVYDRAMLTPEILKNAGPVTLIGDAAHPMSPFKGQGANQAVLDALALAREIEKVFRSNSNWRSVGLRENILNSFEAEMLERSAKKVKGSADAAQFLHSEIVLQQGNAPRGRSLKDVD